MASQLRVNKSENRSGLGTITYTDTGAIVSGIVTANSFSGDIIGDITGAVTATTGSFSGDVSIAEKIIHTGDTNTFMKFDTDTISFETAGSLRFDISSSGHLKIGTASAAGGRLYFESTSGAAQYIASGGTNNQDLIVASSAGEKLRIKADNTVLLAGKQTNNASFTSHNANFYGGNVNTGGVRIEVAHSTTSVSGNTASASFPHHLLLTNYSGNTSADNRMCSIGFDIPTTSTHANAVIAYQATAAGTGDLQFHLESGNSISEKLRLDSTGHLHIKGQDHEIRWYRDDGARYGAITYDGGNFNIRNPVNDHTRVCKQDGTEIIKFRNDKKVVIDNTDGTFTIGGDNVYNSSKVNLQVGSMSQTSATTEATAIVIHDQNSKRNGTESAGSWVSGIRFMSTQINGGSRYGAFVNQDIKYNNFSGGATKMRSDLVFGTRGDVQTGTNDPPAERMRIQHDGKVGIQIAEPKSLLHIYGPGDLRIGSLYGGVALIALQVEYSSGYTGTHFMVEITDQASYSFEGSHIVHGSGGSSYGTEVTVVRMQASREAGAANSGDTWRNGTVKYNNNFTGHDQVGLNPGAGTFSFTYDDTPDGAGSTRSIQKMSFSASGQSVGVWAKMQGVFTWASASTNGRVKIKDKDGNVLWDSNP